MDLIETTERWLAAWRDGDAAAVAAAVDDFADPDTSEPIAGTALVTHAETVLTRFPGLTLDTGTVTGAGEVAVITWTLTAPHRAPYLGIPGTGQQVSFTGTDVLTVRDGTVHVRRHFDRLAVAEAMEHNAKFFPANDATQEYGISTRIGSGSVAQPGALTLTWLDVRDDVEAADVDLLSNEVVKSLLATRGCLGVGTFEIGNRKYTLTAFDRVESVRAVHARPHQRAMRRFFRSGLCVGAFTSVWALQRDSLYLRCPDCGSAVSAAEGKTCDCGWTPTPDSLF